MPSHRVTEDELDNHLSKKGRISLFQEESLLLSEVQTSVSRKRARTRGLFPRALYKNLSKKMLIDVCHAGLIKVDFARI